MAAEESPDLKQIPAGGTYSKGFASHPPCLGQVGSVGGGNGAFSVPYKGKSWPQALGAVGQDSR